HPAAAHWWENAAAFLRERPPADVSAFRAAGPLLPQALGDGLHGDQLGLPAVVGLLADDRGYVQPIAQDIVMQIFGGVDFIRAVEVQAGAYRAWRRNGRPAQSAFPDAAWALLDAVDLEAELRRRVPCIRAPPAFLRGRLRQLYHTALEEVLRADALPGDADGLQKVRAWKLLVLIWRTLLRRTTSTGAPGRRELEARLEQFEGGSLEALLAPSLQGQRPPGGARGAGDAEARRQRLLEDAVALVRAGGLSKARQLLASRGLAPGTAETLAELRDPARRPPRPAADMPPAARAFQPARLVELDRGIWTDCARSAPKGSSSSLSGASFELLKLALDDEALELQAAADERYARAEIPASVARALGTGRMAALLKARDRGLQEALHDLLDLDPAPAEAERLFRVSSLPLGLGGLGLRSAARTAECAYWASWADALPMLRQRNPTAATELTAALRAGTGAAASCLQEAERARAAAARDGFATCPTWPEVWDGARPEQTEPEPGEWKHGWPYHASAARERRYREEVVLPSLTDDQQWMLDSQGGRCGGRHLALIPSTPESTFTPERFRALLQRRLRLPLDATASRCNGRSCQAGGRVRTDAFLRDMDLPGIAANDGRRIEMVADGLPAYHGRQLAIDACIVSPLRATGRPIAQRLRPGLALKRARRRKQTTYPELVGSRRGYLLVAGAETGGRWDEEAYKLLVALARARARSAPAALRGSLATARLRRWSGMLAHAIHDALAATTCGGGRGDQRRQAQGAPDRAPRHKAQAGGGGWVAWRTGPQWDAALDSAAPLLHSHAVSVESLIGEPWLRPCWFGGGASKAERRIFVDAAAWARDAVYVLLGHSAGATRAVVAGVAQRRSARELINPQAFDKHEDFKRAAADAAWAQRHRVAMQYARLRAQGPGSAERFVSRVFAEQRAFKIALVDAETGQALDPSDMLARIEEDLFARVRNDFPFDEGAAIAQRDLVTSIRAAGGGPELASPLGAQEPLCTMREVDDMLDALKPTSAALKGCYASLKSPVPMGRRLTRAVANISRHCGLTSNLWSARQISPLHKSGPRVVRQLNCLRPISISTVMASVVDGRRFSVPVFNAQLKWLYHERPAEFRAVSPGFRRSLRANYWKLTLWMLCGR
ncbi:unnamed protein product, partial [Prorocentrum cordatum]